VRRSNITGEERPLYDESDEFNRFELCSAEVEPSQADRQVTSSQPMQRRPLMELGELSGALARSGHLGQFRSDNKVDGRWIDGTCTSWRLHGDSQHPEPSHNYWNLFGCHLLILNLHMQHYGDARTSSGHHESQRTCPPSANRDSVFGLPTSSPLTARFTQEADREKRPMGSIDHQNSCFDLSCRSKLALRLSARGVLLSQVYCSHRQAVHHIKASN
jgi:hypothetical protein